MKFNYCKEAKENGHSDSVWKFARTLKYVYGDRRYMAAYWLSWAYTFQRIGEKIESEKNIKLFLREIARICSE